MQNILFQWVIWQFFDVPKKILRAWKNILFFNLNYFSIFLLIRTLFYPWRKYSWSHGKGFDIGRYFEVLSFNLISRVLGAIMRIILIIIGITFEVFLFFGGIIIIFGWLVLPVLLIGGAYLGLQFLI